MIVISKLLPDVSDGHGDAENANALAANLSWLGHPAVVVDVPAGQSLKKSNVFVLGHVAPSEFEPAQAALSAWSAELKQQVRDAAIVISVGSGIEMLVNIGLLSGVVTPFYERAVGDVVMSASDAVLWGFENSSAGYTLGAGEVPLGTVRHGVGNGDGTEGVRSVVDGGLILGTHLHGPVLVRNQELMDEVVSLLVGDFDESMFSYIGQRARQLSRENRDDNVAKVNAR